MMFPPASLSTSLADVRCSPRSFTQEGRRTASFAVRVELVQICDMRLTLVIRIDKVLKDGGAVMLGGEEAALVLR